MSELKAVVVAESIDAATDRTDMIQCLGVFNNFAEAYGEGLMFLSELADKDDTITPLFELEGETGYGFSLQDKEGQVIEMVCVLQCGKPYEQQRGGDAT